MEGMRKARIFLVIKKNVKEKIPLGRHGGGGGRFGVVRKVNFQEVGCEVVDWVFVA
jgi:hypothetical protein